MKKGLRKEQSFLFAERFGCIGKRWMFLGTLKRSAKCLQSVFFNAGHVAAGDPKGGGNLALGEGNGSAETVAKTDNFGLPGCQFGFD